jgi:DNA polymerase III epsilon subunit family exonuclease
MFTMRQPDPSPRTPRGSTQGPARDGDFVAVDTETTGLAWHDRIVELGAVRFRGDKVIASWRTLVNPRRPIPESARGIHGLTDEAVRDAPPAVEALTALERFCDGATLLAHNARFDRDVLAAEFVRAGLPLPRNPMYCTWRLSKHGVPESPRHGLIALAKHLQLPAVSSHRALADAELTRMLFLACCDRLPDCTSLATLDALATEGNGPWRFEGAVRRVMALPAAAGGLRAARREGAMVTVHLATGEALRGAPGVVYARGEEVRFDLRGEDGRVTSVALAEVVSVAP